MSLPELGDFSRAVVFAAPVDESFRVLLIVHQRTADPNLCDGAAELLQATIQLLARLLSCTVAWHFRRDGLGEPFNRLTDREWTVLRGLDEEAGEKQLADEMGLSPHTLHSHIKSIYRKVGVQGRLPLLLRAREAMKNLRQEKLKRCPSTINAEKVPSLPKHLAAAAG